MAMAPLIDFSSGAVQRSAHLMPSQGTKLPWQLYQTYARDLLLRLGSINSSTIGAFFLKA